MTVVKRKRKESQFEVFNHFYKMRKALTYLILRDFGYSSKKSEQYLQKIFGGKSYEDLTDSEKQHYDSRRRRQEAFEEWFIGEQAATGEYGQFVL